MTRETKIGLFVGLAFIILFAVVISERGGDRRNTNAEFGANEQLSNSGGTRSAGLRTTNDSSFNGKFPENRPVALTNNSTKPPLAPNSSHVETRVATGLPVLPRNKIDQSPEALARTNKPTPDKNGTTGEVLAFNDPDGRKIKLPPPLHGERPTPREGGFEDASPFNSIPKSESSDDSLAGKFMPPTKTDFTNKTNETTPKSGSGDIVSPLKPGSRIKIEPAVVTSEGVKGDIETPVKSPMQIAQHEKNKADPSKGILHRTKAGESLWKIARQYYGTKASQGVDEIYHANPTILKSRGQVPADQELLIPMLASHTDKPIEAVAAKKDDAKSTKPNEKKIAKPIDDGRTETKIVKNTRPEKKDAKTNKTDDKRESKKVRRYAVRQNDTLERIAERELGNRNRFKEIYQLNKDHMSDMGSLTPGDEIRLPEREKAKSDAKVKESPEKSKPKALASASKR